MAGRYEEPQHSNSIAPFGSAFDGAKIISLRQRRWGPPGSFYQGIQPDRRNKSGKVASRAMPLKTSATCLFSSKEHRHEFQHSTN